MASRKPGSSGGVQELLNTGLAMPQTWILYKVNYDVVVVV